MEINLKKLLLLLRKNIMLIILLVTAFILTSLLGTVLFVTPIYSSSVKLYVDISGEKKSINLNDLNYAQKVINTYIEMINTDEFFKKVEEQSNVNMSFSEVKSAISFKVVDNTEIFTISAKTDNPKTSQALCNTASEIAANTIEELKQSAKLSVVSSASLPASPSSPNLSLNASIGAIIGLFVSISFILLKDIFDVKIKSKDDLENKYNIPILGIIPIHDVSYDESIFK